MKFVFTALLLSNVVHATDLTYCKQAIERFHPSAGLGKTWILSDEGVIVQQDNRKGVMENLALDLEKDGKNYRTTDRFLDHTVKTLVKTRDGGLLASMKSDSDKGGSIETAFSYEKGKCVPQVMVKREYLGADRKTIPKMCDELRRYLDANHKALECNCGTKETNKAIESILKNYSVDMREVKEFARASLSPSDKPSRFNATQGVYVALQAINDCQNAYPGLMRDKVIWADATDAQPEEETAKGKKN